MSKYVKEMLINELSSRIGERTDILVVDSSKLDAISDNKLRAELRAKDITVLTVRNSLARKALNANGVTALDDLLTGPSTLVWGDEDIVSLSKEITKWAKDLDDFEVKGGSLEGSSLSSDDVEALSKSPSREELIGQVVGLILSPIRQLVSAVQGPGAYLAGQIEKIAEEKDED